MKIFNDYLCRQLKGGGMEIYMLEDVLAFSIFVLYILADKWKKTPAFVYNILNSTGILDNYVISGYDVLHTLGKEYLVEDITEYVREKGVSV